MSIFPPALLLILAAFPIYVNGADTFCNICGSGNQITIPTGLVDIPGTGSFSCAVLQENSALVPDGLCPQLPVLTTIPCGCRPSPATPSPSTAAPVAPPTDPPTPAPTAPPTTLSPVYYPSSSSGSMKGSIKGRTKSGSRRMKRKRMEMREKKRKMSAMSGSEDRIRRLGERARRYR